MLNLPRLVFAIFVIVLITPQTPKANILLKALCSKPLAFSYQPAKQWLKKVTWSCIFIFLIIAFFSCAK